MPPAVSLPSGPATSLWRPPVSPELEVDVAVLPATDRAASSGPITSQSDPNESRRRLSLLNCWPLPVLPPPRLPAGLPARARGGGGLHVHERHRGHMLGISLVRVCPRARMHVCAVRLCVTRACVSGLPAAAELACQQGDWLCRSPPHQESSWCGACALRTGGLCWRALHTAKQGDRHEKAHAFGAICPQEEEQVQPKPLPALSCHPLERHACTRTARLLVRSPRAPRRRDQGVSSRGAASCRYHRCRVCLYAAVRGDELRTRPARPAVLADLADAGGRQAPAPPAAVAERRQARQQVMGPERCVMNND